MSTPYANADARESIFGKPDAWLKAMSINGNYSKLYTILKGRQTGGIIGQVDFDAGMRIVNVAACVASSAITFEVLKAEQHDDRSKLSAAVLQLEGIAGTPWLGGHAKNYARNQADTLKIRMETSRPWRWLRGAGSMQVVFKTCNRAKQTKKLL